MESAPVRFAEFRDLPGLLTLYKELRPHDPELTAEQAEARWRGLARATLQYALDFAWSQSCCKVMLLSGMQRGEAHALYESLGFRGDVERGFVIKPASASFRT